VLTQAENPAPLSNPPETIPSPAVGGPPASVRAVAKACPAARIGPAGGTFKPETRHIFFKTRTLPSSGSTEGDEPKPRGPRPDTGQLAAQRAGGRGGGTCSVSSLPEKTHAMLAFIARQTERRGCEMLWPTVATGGGEHGGKPAPATCTGEADPASGWNGIHPPAPGKGGARRRHPIPPHPEGKRRPRLALDFSPARGLFWISPGQARHRT